jgi:DNA-binding CsgD family transcriptional regulator
MSNKYTRSSFKKIAGNPDTHLLSEELGKKMEQILPYFDLLNPSAAFFFVFDFPRMQYLYVSESVKGITGYTAQQWIDGGIDWVITILDEGDAKRLGKLHAALFNFYYSIPIPERKDYKYAYELRFVRKDGKPIWVLQQGSFIEICPDGKPAVTFDILTDITQFKKNKTMTLSMSKENKISCTLYFPIEGDVKFSEREIEILKLISLGLSSKSIGEHLFISSHTVDTHRRNMLRKAEKKDSTALVFYARENGLI